MGYYKREWVRSQHSCQCWKKTEGKGIEWLWAWFWNICTDGVTRGEQNMMLTGVCRGSGRYLRLKTLRRTTGEAEHVSRSYGLGTQSLGNQRFRIVIMILRPRVLLASFRTVGWSYITPWSSHSLGFVNQYWPIGYTGGYFVWNVFAF